MTPADQQIAFIGAGNVATHMAKALRNAGMKIKAVYSHTLASAQTLAAEVEADAIDDIADLPEANIFVYCVKDDEMCIRDRPERNYPNGQPQSERIQRI